MRRARDGTPKGKTWKHAELEIAARLGGKRIPVTGRHTRDVPDLDVPHFAVEVKHRKRLPDWLHEAAQQTPAHLYLSGARVAARFLLLRLAQIESSTLHIKRGIALRPAPAWLRNAFEQAQGASAATGRSPLVVLHEKGMRYDDAICLQWSRAASPRDILGAAARL